VLARISRLLVLTAVLSVLIWPHVRDVSASQTSPRPARTYALLIGASQYPHLARRWWLQGPENDVAMVDELLRNPPFSIPPADIVTLTGWPQAASRRPTRQNIEAQFARLRDIVTAGDQVVVFMAGHGSQQPANPDPMDDEPDGLDELFLPADVAGWDGSKGVIKNAVVDDDVRAWVTAIRNRGAFVWVVFDSCQSGTMVRGNIAERSRQIPLSEFAPAGSRIPLASRDAEQASLMDLPRSDAAGIVAIYASQPDETTPEKRLPSRTSPYHGLFTYTLTKVIRGSSSPLTYRRLVEEIVNSYRSEGRAGPTPMFEGDDIDREILGTGGVMPHTTYAVGERVGIGRRLAAGSIHGITTGTVVEIQPGGATSTPGASVAYAIVTSVEAATAIIEPTSFAGRDAVSFERLSPTSRADIVARGVSFEPLRLVLQRKAAGSQSSAYVTIATGQGPARLESVLQNLGPLRDVATRTDVSSDADWVLRLDDAELTLAPATGWYVSRGGPGDEVPRTFHVGSLNDSTLADRLQRSLRRIAQARNLLKVAGSMGQSSSGLLDIELVRSTAGAMLPVEAGPRGRVLRTGDAVGFRLRNPSAVDVDVTLLHVTDNYGIRVIFPPAGGSAAAGRLAPGELRTTGLFKVFAEHVESEQVIAIAVPALDPPADFASLVQPDLEGSRRIPAEPAIRSPLQALLVNAVGVAPATRGLRVPSIDEHTLRLLAWRVVPD